MLGGGSLPFGEPTLVTCMVSGLCADYRCSHYITMSLATFK